MKLTIARIISFAINPLVVVFISPFLLVYRSTNDLNAAIYWTLYTFIFIMVMGIFVATGVKKQIFTDLDVSRREQRPLMFLISILFVAVYIMTLFFMHAPFILYVLAIGLILGICIVSIINRKIKASVHVAAVTALVLPLAISFSHYYLLLLFFIPLVAWARITTKRHTMPEILVGGTLGGILSVSIYIATKFFLHK
ncbi:hypothetical protein HZA75_05550 [Candidatus Roizmanbacteria bacterium]|nr:hypothetical protein [Candidatus Roizmanbacteria bacterium]